MQINVFGLGYVGMVNAVCLAQEGHVVRGIDINPAKVQMVNQGKSPIVEPQVETMLAAQVDAGRLHATVDANEAIWDEALSLICVGTPSTTHGAPDLAQVEHVCKQIGRALKQTVAPHTVVFRSTMLPGCTAQMAEGLAQSAGRQLGADLHIAFNPEFLREGTAVRDFYAPQYTIIGTEDDTAAAMLETMYRFLPAPIHRVRPAEAEMLKYASNAFHATKVTFANEIGRLSRLWGVNGFRVMDLICQDDVLNISPAYLSPGFAYGGSCLPKDLRSMIWRARLSHVDVPLLESLAWSNRVQIDQAYELIAKSVRSKEDVIGFLGLAFKAGTDDLRESPMVELIERFIGKGHRLLLYDENVSMSRLMGKNKEFIDREIPHLAELMAEDSERVIRESNVLVIGKHRGPTPEALRLLSSDATVIELDLVLNQGQIDRDKDLPVESGDETF